MAGDDVPNPNVYPWNFTSSWEFPYPIQREVVINWTLALHKTPALRVSDLLIDALPFLPVVDAYSFGSPEVAVHVGDVIQPEWEGGNERTIGMNCLVCSAGRSHSGTVEGEGVFDACSSYTDAAHVHAFTGGQVTVAPRTSCTIEDLASSLSVPSTSVGICMMSLSSENGMDANDFTIPFPVLLTPQSPHHRFDPDYPSGTPDPSIPDDPVITTAFSYLQDARPQTSNGFDKRMIPGIVIGVAAGAALIAVGCWLLWRRRGLKKKRVASPVEDGNVRTVRRVGNQDIELTHRPVEDGEDAPPAYHEVVREQRERR